MSAIKPVISMDMLFVLKIPERITLAIIFKTVRPINHLVNSNLPIRILNIHADNPCNRIS